MMKSERRKEMLRNTLCSKKIATMPELKEAIGTNVSMTVFRSLSALGYVTSYSHRGSYYTLHGIPDFDPLGLWMFRGVRFSLHGTLLDTVVAYVGRSESGCTVSELDGALHVETKHAALQLLRRGRLGRFTHAGVHVYVSAEAGARRRQELTRKGGGGLEALGADGRARLSADELKAAIILFFSMLDERQRRLYAGLESSKLGHGGDRRLAELLGLDTHTVAKGRRELLGGDVGRGRLRAEGGGRPRTEKKSPG